MELTTNVYLVFKAVSIMSTIIYFMQERLFISLKSSFEIQLLLTDDDMSDIPNNINTREIGPEFHFYLPKYFLINKLGNLKEQSINGIHWCFQYL